MPNLFQHSAGRLAEISPHQPIVLILDKEEEEEEENTKSINHVQNMAIAIERLLDLFGNPSDVYKITADDPESIEKLSLLDVEKQFRFDNHNYQGSRGNIERKHDPNENLIKWIIVATRIEDDNS